MPPILPPTDPDPNTAASTEPSATPNADAPVSFVPHEATGAVATPPAKIYTGRFGELEAHELVKLLSTLDDERAKGRFRESVYISVFFWLAVAWFIFYGPSVLWHAPKLILPSDVLQKRELTSITSPILAPHAVAPRPAPKPLDNRTLDKLREMSKRAPSAAPPPPKPSVAPLPNAPAPNIPPPVATPLPTHTPPPPVVAEAPQPNTAPRTAINSGKTSPSDAMHDLMRDAARGHGSLGTSGVSAPIAGGGAVGSGSTILTDTQGVDFTAWQRHFDRGTIQSWLPLLPEEIQPPLSKKGDTYLLITILSDGTIADMKLENSSHDDALNRAAWGSIVSQGKVPALPPAFKGPSITLRLHYMVNEEIR